MCDNTVLNVRELRLVDDAGRVRAMLCMMGKENQYPQLFLMNEDGDSLVSLGLDGDGAVLSIKSTPLMGCMIRTDRDGDVSAHITNEEGMGRLVINLPALHHRSGSPADAQDPDPINGP